MNDKKTAAARIWQDRFNDSRQWMEMVHSRLNNDRDCLSIEKKGEVVSQMILRDIDYIHLGQPLPATYIYGAATRRDCQRQGYMSQLMVKALDESYKRGAAVTFLKPAHRWLYGFYARNGFATTVYIDEQRFMPDHIFASDDSQFQIDEAANDTTELSQAYNRLASGRSSTTLHSPADIKTIMIDNSIDDGVKTVVRRAADGSICAIAFATVDGDNAIAVKDIVAADELTAEIALGAIARKLPGRTMVVEAAPFYRNVRLEARGMARIVNVAEMLRILSSVNPKLNMQIRVVDPIIDENNHIFVVENGKVTTDDDLYATPLDPEKDTRSARRHHLDLDVTIDVLTSILFSNDAIGGIFNLPTARPFISLLLD